VLGYFDKNKSNWLNCFKKMVKCHILKVDEIKSEILESYLLKVVIFPFIYCFIVFSVSLLSHTRVTTRGKK
jgi:hypothetical protein